MKTESIKTTMVFLGAIIFTIIFWNEKLGVNTLIFDLFIIVSVFRIYPFSLKSNTCRWLTAAHIITSAAILIQNTVLSKIAFSTTLLLLVSFSQYLHRSVWFAGGSILMNYFFAIPNFFRQFKNVKAAGLSLKGLSKPVRMLIIPMLIVGVFFIVYSLANAVVSDIVTRFIGAVERWFSHFFEWFSIPRFLFFLLGIVITAGLLLRSRYTYFSDKDLAQENDLTRKKDRLKKWKQSAFSDLLTIIVGKRSTGILALKTEFIIGFISLILLNLLLLFINILDVKYVWLGFTFKADVNLSGYVHEGAGLLIFSIVLAMLLLLFFFRANLNFYRKNTWLRYGAYLWIFQNLFLVVSVLIRDYYYISHYGLAYKRIGLLFFLFMVVTGLITVFIKIRGIKTTYYLLRINAWAGIFLLVISSTIHWDETIASYNLQRKSTLPLDIHFLLSLSDKTLPLIEKNKDVLEKDVHTGDLFYYQDKYYNAVSFFEYRKKYFLEEQKNYTWLSWNVADDYVRKQLAEKLQEQKDFSGLSLNVGDDYGKHLL